MIGRDLEMIRLFRCGMPLSKIAAEYGISRQRVHQILKRNGITRRDGGVTPTRKRRHLMKSAKREASYIARYGCTRDEYTQLRQSEPIAHKAFREQRTNASARKVEWNLTFWEWWHIWQESGKWEQRGRGAGQYCMCRHGDVGAYERGNVFIGEFSQNCSHNALKRWGEAA